MDIRPLAEAVMETAGKIKNDNMSGQDFYKFKFLKLRNLNLRRSYEFYDVIASRIHSNGCGKFYRF